MNESTRATLKRLAACVAGGLVLALMVGNQEGTLTDFGIAFREAVLRPRVFVFIALGLILFVLITFWPRVVPYLHRPGVSPLGIGALGVIASQTVMNWYDPLASSSGSGKFNAVRSAASSTASVSWFTDAFYSWLAWTLLAIGIVGCGAAVVTLRRPIGYVVALAGVAGAVLAYTSHSQIVDIGGGIDHSLGMYVDIVGFLVVAAAGITAVHSRTDTAETRTFVNMVLDFRPGLPLVVVALIWGLLAFTTAGWFGALQINEDLSQSASDFSGTAVSSLTTQYLKWLGWTLFAVCIIGSAAATWLRHRVLAWVTAAISFIAIVLTFFTLKSMTDVGAKLAPQYGTSWKNLGAGGFVACLVFALILAACVLCALSTRPARTDIVTSTDPTRRLPVSAMVDKGRTSSRAKAILIIGMAFALFYPPTLPVTWQNVIVTQIGVFVLLAIGLNVVVGWAGLLDLGYIAFYEIGSYTTAYLVGALPVKPPSWLLHWFEHSPLLTIPFAIVACLIAGVLLGAPTLRLRGDYLAIVTLGFGEIIQIIATNNPGGFTGGPQGPTVPHPHIHIGALNITWGQDNLPYWYLLLVMLVVVLVLFYRLEGSRLGRAWAAIREDEIAAQASGVNTMRVKLLAFAIGASTSALAGSFFATQVGYFDPTLFTLQASILIVAYVVFGGMGSLQGAIAGAAALTWLPQFLKDQVPKDDRQMWIGALVLAMMIFRPAGLLPARRRKAELEGMGSPASSEVAAVPASEGL